VVENGEEEAEEILVAVVVVVVVVEGVWLNVVETLVMGCEVELLQQLWCLRRNWVVGR